MWWSQQWSQPDEYKLHKLPSPLKSVMPHADLQVISHCITDRWTSVVGICTNTFIQWHRYDQSGSTSYTAVNATQMHLVWSSAGGAYDEKAVETSCLYTKTLMMETDSLPETSDYLKHLAPLSVRDDFIESCIYVCPHVSSPELLNGFPWNLILVATLNVVGRV
jgi:hypothetical protein